MQLCTLYQVRQKTILKILSPAGEASSPKVKGMYQVRYLRYVHEPQDRQRTSAHESISIECK